MIKPYYQDDYATIYHGDCLKILPELPEVDLVLTSPPYDNLRDYGGYVFNYTETIKSLPVVDGGVVVWVVGDQVINKSESGTSFKQALYFMEIGYKLHDTMIYKKFGCVYPDKTRYDQVFEYKLIISKGRPKRVNLINGGKNISGDRKYQ